MGRSRSCSSCSAQSPATSRNAAPLATPSRRHSRLVQRDQVRSVDDERGILSAKRGGRVGRGKRPLFSGEERDIVIAPDDRQHLFTALPGQNLQPKKKRGNR